MIVTGWASVVKKIPIIEKSKSHVKYDNHIVFVILIIQIKKKIVKVYQFQFSILSRRRSRKDPMVSARSSFLVPISKLGPI